MKIPSSITEYLTECEIRKYTPRTLRSYKNNLSLFCNFCLSIGVEDTTDLTLGTVKQFTKHMMHNGRKATYINGLLKTIKSYITYIYEEYGEGFNTKKSFKWLKEEKPVIQTFSPADIKKLFKNCCGNDFMDIRDTCILTMFFETGIRCLELCSIKESDIHSDFIIINGKNHKQRVVPITPPLKKAMHRYDRCKEAYFDLRQHDNNYFLSFHGRMLNNSAVENVLRKRGQGIEGIRISPHTCRHTNAQQLLKQGLDVYTISRLLGHENIAITQTYLRSLSNDSILEIARGHSVLQNL